MIFVKHKNFSLCSFFRQNKPGNNLALSKKEKKKEKTSYCLQKPWVNPFTKITKIATFKNLYLYSHKSLSFDLEHHQTLFQGLFSQKRKKKFSQKSWVSPFTKIPKMATFEIGISKL